LVLSKLGSGRFHRFSWPLGIPKRHTKLARIKPRIDRND
jgi:hypothetical protein